MTQLFKNIYYITYLLVPLHKILRVCVVPRRRWHLYTTLKQNVFFCVLLFVFATSLSHIFLTICLVEIYIYQTPSHSFKPGHFSVSLISKENLVLYSKWNKCLGYFFEIVQVNPFFTFCIQNFEIKHTVGLLVKLYQWIWCSCGNNYVICVPI